MTANEMDKAGPLEKDHVEFSIASKNTMEYVEPKGDYSGATQKTDPVEIRLVRKLDRRILVGNSPLDTYSH